MFKIAFRQLQKASKMMEQEERKLKKAASLAVTRTAYQLHRDAWRWLQRGQLGLKPLSVLHNRPKGYRRSKRKRNRDPLTSLGRGIVYKSDWKNLTADVGFLAVSEGTAWQAKIAEKSAHGYYWTYSPGMRARLHRMGIHLRKATTGARVPARDIMGHVLLKKGGDGAISREIRDKFERKMRGERI